MDRATSYVGPNMDTHYYAAYSMDTHYYAAYSMDTHYYAAYSMDTHYCGGRGIVGNHVWVTVVACACMLSCTPHKVIA